MDESLVEFLEWDSHHFGCAIARVREVVSVERIQAALEFADNSGVQCLTALIDANQTAATSFAEEVGFRCYDVRIELDRPVDPAFREPVLVRQASEADLPILEPISRDSFLDSRFYADPRFSNRLASELYVKWLRRGLADDDRLLLTTPNLKGFVVCHLDPAAKRGTIELIAVAQRAGEQGHGGHLIQGAEAAFASGGMTHARVVTQGRNVAAQRLYQRYGYRTSAVALWLHRWATP